MKPVSCPFCGTVAVVEQVEARGTSGVRFSVGCMTPDDFVEGEGDRCFGHMSFATFNTKAEAVTAWNRRAVVPQLVEALQEARKSLSTAIKANWEPTPSDAEVADHRVIKKIDATLEAAGVKP